MADQENSARKWKFESKVWKIAAIFAYLGMQTAGILMTSVLPLTFMRMGESDSQVLAGHAVSLRFIGRWLVGICGIIILVDTLAIAAAMTKHRKFRAFPAVLLPITVCLVVTLFIWGMVESESRKDYFRNTWNDMDSSTQYIIQKHYCCCGFDSYTEVESTIIPVDLSCYAIATTSIYWPNGCYERVTSSSITPVTVTNSANEVVKLGSEKTNIFLDSFLASFVVLIFVQLAATVAFSIAIYTTHTSVEVDSPAYVNNSAFDSQNSHHNNNSTSLKLAEMGNGEALNKKKDNEGIEDSSQSEKKPWYQKLSDSISEGFRNAFYWLGIRVGTHPKMTILFSLLLSGTLSIGLLQRYEEPAGSGSFLSENSQIVKEYEVLQQTFILQERDHRFLVVDESDVLSTTNFQTTLNLDISMKSLTSSDGNSFSDICVKVSTVCTQRSLFEFWSFDATVLNGLSNADILTEVNRSPLTSPVFSDEVDVSHILGGISRDGGGLITSARAHILHYVTQLLDPDWEERFITFGNQNHDGVSVYVNAASSRRLESRNSFQKELPLLFAGFGLIFIYIMVMTGKFSLLEHRTYVALLGVTTAGLAMGAGIGLSAAFGLTWTALHLIAPFLIIGIGVDDMFIIIQAWNCVEDNKDLDRKPTYEKAGHVLKIAGPSITVTSITDLVAFGVGASSELGGFSGFNLYVAICIILLFFLECTFFLACTVLDERRRGDRYDACLACCYKHSDSYEPGECSKREYFSAFFEDGLGRIVNQLPFAIIVIAITLGVTGLMTWGFYKLPVRYDPDWYLPSDSYLLDFNSKYETFFSIGEEASVYVINADFYAERAKLNTLYNTLNNNPLIDNKYLKSWFEDFVTWASSNKGITDVYATDAFTDSANFYSDVQEFLLAEGRTYINSVVFRDSVIVGSKFPLRHKIVSDATDNIEIIDSIRANCDSVGFSSWAFPSGSNYFNHEITKIIRKEVYRNLGITLACVFLIVLPLVASLQMGVWILITVVFTMVDVAGTMYLTGLTIEASTIITLLLSVGLAVDYASHVAHKFLTLRGTRKMRIRVTMGQIGPAVFNGGFSTFLALVLLSGSDTYSYRIFFTVFVCVVGYGLWNGLVFLPCILSIIGPAPYANATEAKLSQRHYAKKNKVTDSNSESPVEQKM